MILVSVIIPFYNSERTLKPCLLSVQAAVRENMEVILVNDGSRDDSIRIAAEFPFRIIHLEKQSGPAAGRNRGAREAEGKYLLFVDSDVILHEDSIENLVKTYEDRSDIVGVSAIYSDQPAAPGLFQEFKALEETYKYSCYRADQYSSFDAHCGSVRKDVFFEIGGFNTAYKGADTEDVEFGHVLSKKYKNCINPAVKVDHFYAKFSKGIKNYCWRSFCWVELFLSRLKFEQAVTTGSNAFSVLLATLSVPATLLGLWKTELLWLVAICLATFVLWNIRFFIIASKRTGFSSFYKLPVFLFYLYSLQLAVGAGAATGMIYWGGRKLVQRLRRD